MLVFIIIECRLQSFREWRPTGKEGFCGIKKKICVMNGTTEVVSGGLLFHAGGAPVRDRPNEALR